MKFKHEMKNAFSLPVRQSKLYIYYEAVIELKVTMLEMEIENPTNSHTIILIGLLTDLQCYLAIEILRNIT